MLLDDFLTEATIVYVTRTVERALGMTPRHGFHIISNDSPAATSIQKDYPHNALLIKEKEELDTHELLQHPHVVEYIGTLKRPHIVVFKNTLQIERICKEHHWTLVNPSAELANKVEGKISQVSWLHELTSYLPPHDIVLGKDLVWKDTPFILQFNHGHTGEGTIYVETGLKVQEIQEKFPLRQIRTTTFIDGPVFTSNNIVSDTKNIPHILEGNISYQITGLEPFTSLPFSTIGNDWALPHTLLSQDHKKIFSDMVQHIGAKLHQDGWKGLFGIDVKLDSSTGKLYLLEINARQPASTTFESTLQRKINLQGLTVFEAHLAALLGIQIDQELIPLTKGAQIVQRRTKAFINGKTIDTSKLREKGLIVVEYSPSIINSDLYRIQSTESLMTDHMILNDVGNYIKNILM